MPALLETTASLTVKAAFKNYMLTIPHRIELGTYGAAAREKNPKDRFGVLNKKKA